MVGLEEASEMGIKIEQATRGLTRSFSKRLSVLSSEQASVICDYTLALRSEIRLSDNYRMSILNTLISLSPYGNNKRFKDFTRADIIRYLDHFRKDENGDPSHQWVGTYNGNLINVVKFFRWLHNLDLGPTDRPRHSVVQNLRKLRRLEISLYKPADMWTPEENLLFLKYCPNARDRCFHAIQVDIGCRPHEILKLRIKDLEFKEGDNGQRYAEIVVNGKTDERGLPLIDSIPYITQWISLHPQGSNREAILLPNKRNGKAIQAATLIKIYKNYKSYFTELLSRQDVLQEDKQRINELLRKKWNPYVHRHSTITHKYDTGEISSDGKMKQFFGWTPRSNMLSKYVHFIGNEAKKHLRTKGLLRDEKVVDILEPKMCPHCREPNRPDAQFCFKCNFVMSFEAYHKAVEERERKDQELQALRNEILETRTAQQKKEDEMQIMKEHMARMEESQLKITELLEVMKIAKSRDGKEGKDRTMLDEKRRVTIGYVDDNNQNVEMKVPVDGFEIDEAA